jgi:hypothetical protein
MTLNKIEFPELPIYYIILRELDQTTPTSYGYINSDQVLATSAEHIQQFTDFNLWKTELATYGITVALNEEGNWYKVE